MVERIFSLDGELAGFRVGTSCNQSFARRRLLLLLLMMIMMMMMTTTTTIKTL
jgi:hypothetical protein